MSSDAWQSPPLASEQVDLDAESRRLEAFSRYVPKFYFANGPLSAVSGDSLPLLAESLIWDVSADDFFAVLEKWCYQPEIVNPPVERAEISRDEAATSYKTVTRRLISKRRDKDNDLVERVLFSRSTNGKQRPGNILPKALGGCHSYAVLTTSATDSNLIPDI
ncbi:tRNA(Ser) Um(44) 2'-O-methyltransferase [Spiromyces aspiralis]|uniref:tRNA(Ser) Um(44) 2'-O-methyltransferase n=1 Tax=Spiromyces aspiralis TaxID=68401 RepID=A0ACC1HKU8_9FUNG|nr:tRNA(Ser) Um(44) 2'-O-methyltransferase [Spiromyces aspiralis]